jgi:hypothetical protein
MHDLLRARLMRHIESLPEAQVYQALDFVEFLSSKYARDSLREPGVFQKFSEMLEDKMRGQGLAFGTIKGTLGVMGAAGRVVSGITEAGRTVIREVESVITPEDEPPAQLPRPVRQPDGDPRGGDQAAG